MKNKLKIKQLILITAMIVCKIGYAQNTCLGFNIGFNGSFYKFNQMDNFHSSILPSNITFGVILEHEISNKLIIGSGINKVDYTAFINYNELKRLPFSPIMETIQIPLNVGYEIPVLKNKFALIPFIGINLCFYRENTFWASIRESRDNTVNAFRNFEYVRYGHGDFIRYKKSYLLAETGFTLNYSNKKDINLSISYRYNYGLSSVVKQNVEYWINDIEYEGYFTSNGNYHKLLLGLKYPINNFTNNEKRQRIKNEKEKEIKDLNKSKYYISFDIGLTHNVISSANPDIIPLNENSYPLNDFISGLNFGLKINPKLSIETGIGILFYKYRMSIDNNDSVFYATSASSPENEFYCFPFRLKYNYYLLDNKLTLVPYVGFTILTHSLKLGQYNPRIGATGDELLNLTFTAERENRFYVLLSAGIGLEYALMKRLQLTLYCNNNLGFKDLNNLNIIYNNGIVNKEGKINYKGSNINFTFGFKVPLGFN
ncbi:hypothetical protein ACFLTE_10285 [Bacteroidota bacterium]